MNKRNVNCTEDHTKEWCLNVPCEPQVPFIPPQEDKACDSEDVLAEVQALCSFLKDPKGPFASCHTSVDPNWYYRTCVYDTCELYPVTVFSCKSMEMYYYDCQNQNNWELDALATWRSAVEHCENTCPGGMHYNPKGSACPASCAYPTGYDQSCPFPHLETCECSYGMVFDGTRCIWPKECGCLLEDGRYLSKGEEYVEEDCSTSVLCVRRNDVRRVQRSCVLNAECNIKNGRRDCYCRKGYQGDGREECNTGHKACHIYGDPHFDTYDDYHYSFQGDCTYIATRTCEDPPDGFPLFEIQIETDKLVPSERFTWMTAVIFIYEGKTYRMSHTGAKTVDGEDIRDSLPFVDEDTGVQIIQNGEQYILVTDFDLTITYDGRYDAVIDLPAAYQGKVCGLCGNADNDDTNEKMSRNGTVVKKKLDFANSWGARKDCPIVTKPVETCDKGSSEERVAVDSCDILLQKDGPLASCHDFRDPEGFYNSCVFDLCGTLPSMEQLCRSLEQYVLACRRNGGTPSSDWRNSVPACKPFECPAGYVPFQRSCYKYFPDPKDFKSAKADCQSQCAHLVTITSRAENEFIAGFAQNQISWIGAERNFENSALEFESNGDEVYVFLPERLPKDTASFKFSVQTEGDAHLILSSHTQLESESPLYEIVLGGRDDPTTFIRRCLGCGPESAKRQSFLRGDRATTFFITIKGSIIEIGLNYRRRILSLDEEDRMMDIRHVAFRTDVAPGTWKFYNSEFDCVTGESLMGFNNFRMGEPNNKNQENCLEINYGHEPGEWNDKKCNIRTSYVCEIDAE